MSTIIKPTIGRVIWYYRKADQTHPNVGLIAYVHSDTLINVGGFDHDGDPFKATSVPLVQPTETERGLGVTSVPVHGHFATWMPYQKGQAAKTEALEKKLEDATTG